MEVIRRNRPNMPIQADHKDIPGYCETCQTAYRLGWEVFQKIANGINKQDIITHNVDIHIHHRRWAGEQLASIGMSQHTNKRLHEHAYSLYSHQYDDYLVHAGVQVLLPLEPHTTPCRSTTIEIDLPIRKGTQCSIKTYTEETMHNVIHMTRNLTPNGRSVVDQRENTYSIETKIRVVVGDSSRAIPREHGWFRKETHYHGQQPRAKIPVAKEAEEAPPPEKPSTPDSIEIEAMEIDYREAQPWELSNQDPMTIKRAAMPTGIDNNIPASGPSLRRSRVHRNAVQEDTRPKETGEGSDDNILLFRKGVAWTARTSEAGPSRQPYRGRTSRLRDEAQLDAESVRTGNL